MEDILVELMKKYDAENEVKISKDKMCECFYDLYIQPRFMDECYEHEETARGLAQFLEIMGMSFDEFYDTVWSYSLGCGLDYMKDLNNYIIYERPPMNEYNDDNFMEF